MIKKNYKYYWFLFRWFLIGRFHCDIPQEYKKYWRIGFYLLWMIILFFFTLGLCSFLHLDIYYTGRVLQ